MTPVNLVDRRSQWMYHRQRTTVCRCPAGIALELKDIHMSAPDVNMNYIKSLLFLDVCIEIVTVKQSALSLFSFLKIWFYVCLCFYFSTFFNFFFSSVWFNVTAVIFVAFTFVTCFNKDQSINQSFAVSVNALIAECQQRPAIRASFHVSITVVDDANIACRWSVVRHHSAASLTPLCHSISSPSNSAWVSLVSQFCGL